MKVCIVSYDEYINIPYIIKYEECLKKQKITYDIILWDRRNVMDDNKIPDNYYVFKSSVKKSRISKLMPFYRWRKFTIDILTKLKYDKVIVLTTLPGVLISKYLIKNYGDNYIFDIRDFTYENVLFYKNIVNHLVKKSAVTFISSEGFRDWLEPDDKICLTHNISNIDEENRISNMEFDPQDIVIGFVGGIRYYDENCAIIDNLKNKQNIKLLYAGKVHAGIRLEDYCKTNDVKNAVFEPAFYNHEKPHIYQNIDIINAVYGSGDQIVRTALPNKLYDCILFKKPIMVSKGTYLAKIVDQYHLGFAVDEKKDDIYIELMKYIEEFNGKLFLDGCEELKQKVIHEEYQAIKKINSFFYDPNALEEI